MIQRDNRSVSECGVHLIGPGMVGRHSCPACIRMVEDARTAPLENRHAITGQQRRHRRPTPKPPKSANPFARRASSKSDHAFAMRDRAGGRT